MKCFQIKEFARLNLGIFSVRQRGQPNANTTLDPHDPPLAPLAPPSPLSPAPDPPPLLEFLPPAPRPTGTCHLEGKSNCFELAKRKRKLLKRAPNMTVAGWLLGVLGGVSGFGPHSGAPL